MYIVTLIGQLYSINPSVPQPYTPWGGFTFGAGKTSATYWSQLLACW